MSNEQRNADLQQLLQTQTQLIQAAIDEFNAEPTSDIARQALNNKLIDYLQPIIDEPRWQESLLLRNMLSDYQALYSQALQQRDSFANSGISSVDRRSLIKDDQVEIFILLYQVNGYDLSRWNTQLEMLLQKNLMRPMYATEEGVNIVLRARLLKTNDAYIVAIIQRDKLLELSQGLRQVDRYDQKLVYLADHALASDSFVEFVHLKNRYPIVNGRIAASELL